MQWAGLRMGSDPISKESCQAAEEHGETQKNQAGGVAIFRRGLKNGVGTTFAETW